MAVSEDFLDYVIDQLSSWGGVSARRMFGGAGLYRGGLMFGLVAEDTVYLRVDDTNRAAFESAGSEAFRPYGGTAAMPYYELPVDVLEDAREFAEWSRKALDAASRNRKKPPKKK